MLLSLLTCTHTHTAPADLIHTAGDVPELRNMQTWLTLLYIQSGPNARRVLSAKCRVDLQTAACRFEEHYKH